MKIQYMSDIHREFHADRGKAFIDSLPVAGDVLVVAGDYVQWSLFTSKDLIKVYADLLHKGFSKVIIVLGNHEYYGTDPNTVAWGSRKLQDALPDLGLLEPGTHIEVGSTRFLGGTMWFPEPPDEEYIPQAKVKMRDFNLIKGLEPWCYEQNAYLRRYLLQNCRKGDVVVTHHLPTARSTPERYAASTLNPFFVSDMTEVIAECEPALWVHGHTHDGCDYKLFNTRIVCNPLGYPHELESGANFNMEATVTVGDA